MNISVAVHPDKDLVISSSTIIYYKISIIDSTNVYLHYQYDDKSTLPKLNDLLADIKDTASGDYKVSLSLSFYNNQREFVSCMFISEESDLMREWNTGVNKGSFYSSVGVLNYQGSKYSENLTLYLITEEQAKTDIDWENQKQNYDLETLLSEITELESILVTGRQKLEDKRKLSAELTYYQSGISETEQNLSKIEIGPFTNLYTAYLRLSRLTMTPALRVKYNAMLEIQRNWNILADQLGLGKIVDKSGK